jgi:hypothetical protein
VALFEITDSGLTQHDSAQFAELGLYERQDLQQYLRKQPSALGEDLLIIAEEFGQWTDGRRRIDLLGIDRHARLVVIELKRTDDGGHMELQALRYAAMVASMGFDEVVEAYEEYLTGQTDAGDGSARDMLLEFLQMDADIEPSISTEVRILLVSADFSREITTTVLWLNRFEGMDIRCIRLVPYKIDDRVLLDIQQVIPLPEAGDFQVRMRRKEAAQERSVRVDGRDFTRYHVIVNGVELPDENKRNAIRVMVEQLVERGVSPDQIKSVMHARALPVVPGLVTDRDELTALLTEHYPHADPHRHWLDRPILDRDTHQTYILFKMWGRNTELTLQALTDAFPDSGVTFRAAD